MQDGTANRVRMNLAGQTVLRMLIASYFIAVSLRIIPGTDLGLLFSAVLPAPWNAAFAAGMVFLLSFMIMLAVYTRVAALILALMTFYASYLAMVELGVAQELGSFWRDLALIAALLLTYTDTTPERGQHRRALHRAIAPRRVAPMLDRVEASGLAAHATPVKPTMPLRPLLPPMPVRRMAGATAMAGAEEMWSPAPTPASAPAPETESAPIPMPRRPVRTRAEIAESATDIPGEDYETEIDNVFADVFEPQTSGTPRNPTDPEGGQNA